MNVRELTLPGEFEACIELQRDGFGWDDRDLMPTRFFVVSRHIGGLVLGAFEGDVLIGFLSAIPGVRNGVPYWHSHMLAVTKDRRDAGIGSQLKREQREQALKRGIRLIEWTFDPLVSRNAYLNLEKLGVIVRRYYPAFYGGDTDRLIAEWWLDKPRPTLGGEVRRVSIPASAMGAQQARLRVRQEFLNHFAEDFVVVAFERKGDFGDYILIRGAAHVDRAG